MSARIVSIRLWGGLCNRLFQIACCYRFAEKYNMKPVFYTMFFNPNDHTPQPETIAILKELIPNIEIQNTVVSENDFYIIEVCGDLACKYVDLELPSNAGNRNVLLKGYFQSEKYFPILEDNKFLASYTKSMNSINPDHLQNIVMDTGIGISKRYFIHIRMGDYVGHYLHYLGYRNYLQKAIQYILVREPNAKFMICSNEKDKSKILKEINISDDGNTINPAFEFEFEIDINPELNPLKTLRNMALCNGGGICFNSSFSWFGAYLSKLYNTNDFILGEQIFIMPDKWFNERYIPKTSYQDIYPEWKELVIMDI
jgi:hypothetical protein